MSSKFKFDKYQDRIKDELNLFLRQDAGHAVLQFVSITKVELTQDYSHAKVYWDTFDNSKRGTIKKLLESLKSQMKKKLSQQLSVRKIPQLSLVYDSQFDSELEIDTILEEERKQGKKPSEE